MRRLLSPVRLLVIHLPTAGAWLPFAPAAFSRLLSQPVSCLRWAGALPQFRPSLFLEVMRVKRMALEAGGGADASDSE